MKWIVELISNPRKNYQGAWEPDYISFAALSESDPRYELGYDAKGEALDAFCLERAKQVEDLHKVKHTPFDGTFASRDEGRKRNEGNIYELWEKISSLERKVKALEEECYSPSKTPWK